MSTLTPLPALLSQALVAYSVEFADEFAGRMGREPHSVSLYGWSNFWRFADPDGMSVADARAGGAADTMLSCYERWRFLTFEPSAGADPIPRTFIPLYGMEARDGFGSTRGIRKDWIIRPTEKGARVIHVGPSVSRAIDTRWSSRFDACDQLRDALITIAGEFAVEYPHCIPASGFGRPKFPPRRTPDVSRLPLSTLLSQVLAGFAADFDGGAWPGPALAPLITSASLLRVLDTTGVPLANLPGLTGLTSDSLDPGNSSPEVRLGLIAIEPDPNAKRAKLIRLTEKGDQARADYPRRAKAIEKAWRERFGAGAVDGLRRSLESVMADTEALRAGLAPPDFSIRSPKLEVPGATSATGRSRARAVVTQTEAFLRDPAGSLPHFPVWALTHGWAI